MARPTWHLCVAVKRSALRSQRARFQLKAEDHKSQIRKRMNIRLNQVQDWPAIEYRFRFILRRDSFSA